MHAQGFAILTLVFGASIEMCYALADNETTLIRSHRKLQSLPPGSAACIEDDSVRQRMKDLEKELETIKSLKNELVGKTSSSSILIILMFLIGVGFGFALSELKGGIQRRLSPLVEGIKANSEKIKLAIQEKNKRKPKRQLKKLTKKKKSTSGGMFG